MRLRLCNPHQLSPSLQTSIQTLAPKAHQTVRQSLMLIIHLEQTLSTHQTPIPDTQPTQTHDTQPTLTHVISLTHDINQILGSHRHQIQGFRVTKNE